MTDAEIPQPPAAPPQAPPAPEPERISPGDLADKMGELRGDRPQPRIEPLEVPTDRPITRNDFVHKFSELKGGVDERTNTARNQAIQIAAVAAGAIVLIGFVLGVRRGRAKTTVVEIRRV